MAKRCISFSGNVENIRFVAAKNIPAMPIKEKKFVISIPLLFLPLTSCKEL